MNSIIEKYHFISQFFLHFWTQRNSDTSKKLCHLKFFLEKNAAHSKYSWASSAYSFWDKKVWRPSKILTHCTCWLFGFPRFPMEGRKKTKSLESKHTCTKKGALIKTLIGQIQPVDLQKKDIENREHSFLIFVKSNILTAGKSPDKRCQRKSKVIAKWNYGEFSSSYFVPREKEKNLKWQLPSPTTSTSAKTLIQTRPPLDLEEKGIEDPKSDCSFEIFRP